MRVKRERTRRKANQKRTETKQTPDPGSQSRKEVEEVMVVAIQTLLPTVVVEEVAVDLDPEGPKISRREADKINIPAFPKVTHLDAWQAAVTTNVLAACADTNQSDWIKWLQESFKPMPDVEGLNDSGHVKFRSIDVKLASAMTLMLRNAGDQAADLFLEVNLKSNAYIRGNEYKVLKGRQIIAMMMESFRARDRLDMVYTIDYLTKLQYPGDNKIAAFKATWLEIISRIRPEDVPSTNALRDILYQKISGSSEMNMELKLYYDIKSYDDPERSHDMLLRIMDRAVQRRREKKNLNETQHGLNQMVAGKDLLAAPARPDPKGPPSSAPDKDKKKKTNERGKDKEAADAAPVLPKSKAKAHEKDKKKGKGKGKERSRSPSSSRSLTDKEKAKIRCKFHFGGGCNAGKNCKWSHKDTDRGRPSSRDDKNQRVRSPSSKPSERPCFQWSKNGSCSRENCPFKHDPAKAAPATGETDANAKAKAKAKAKDKKKKPEPAAPAIAIRGLPAVPVLRSLGDGDGDSDDESIDGDAASDCSTDDEIGSYHRDVKDLKVSFERGTKFASSKPRRSHKDRGFAPRLFTEANLKHENHISEVEYEKHKARARARLMEDMCLGKDGGCIPVRIPGTEKVIMFKFDNKKGKFHERALSVDESRKELMKNPHMCMVQPEFIHRKLKFIMDTGCGHDLISLEKGRQTRHRHCNGLRIYIVPNGEWCHYDQPDGGILDEILQGAHQSTCIGEYTFCAVSWEEMHASRLFLCVARGTSTIYGERCWREDTILRARRHPLCQSGKQRSQSP